MSNCALVINCWAFSTVKIWHCPYKAHSHHHTHCCF
jgi:hypothetical protein